MMRLRASAAFALLLLSVTPTVAAAQPVEQTVEEHRDDRGEIDRRGADFVHRASGYVFPGQLGPVPARKTTTFGPSDASLYYTLQGPANGDAWITLYVYPASLPLAEEQAGVEGVIVGNYGATRIARPSQIAAAPAGALEGWFSAKIDGIDAVSGVRVAQGNGWNIKVRVSIPVSGGEAALKRAAAALAVLPMTPAGLRRPVAPSPSQPPSAATR